MSPQQNVLLIVAGRHAMEKVGDAMLKWNLPIVAAMLLAGCSPQPNPAVPALPISENDDVTEVTVRVMDLQGVRMLIESYRGKVVVVDYWSTDCPPCIRELPGLVELSKTYPDNQLRCMTVSLDYVGIVDTPPESYKPKVLGILQPLGAKFDNILCSIESEKALQLLDLAAPPAVDVYDQQGRLAKRFDNSSATNENEAFTYEEVKRLVQELMQRPGPEAAQPSLDD